MTYPANRPSVDGGRLRAGGAATALVAALVTLVGVLVCKSVFDVVMVRPPLLPIVVPPAAPGRLDESGTAVGLREAPVPAN
jgi:hypothetical protein